MTRATLYGQARAGLAAATVAVPLSIGLGIFALSPLSGAAGGLVQQGAHAGLLTVAVGTLTGVAAAAFARRKGMSLVLAPGSLLAFLIGATTLQVLADRGLSTGLALGCLALITVIAGALQVGFGLIRMGNLVKYVPHPVIGGFQNAAALLLIYGQVELITGVSATRWLHDAAGSLAGMPALAPLVAAGTFAVCWLADKTRSRVPAVPAGILAGTLLHHLLAATGAGPALGAMVGESIDSTPGPGSILSTPGIAIGMVHDPALSGLLPVLLLAALSIALLASLDTLVNAKTIEGNGRIRMNGNGLLLRAGMANVAGGAAGGIPVTVNLEANHAAIRAGGLSATGLAICAALTLLALALSGPMFWALPRAVIGGSLAFVALQLFDRWTVRAMPRLVRGDSGNRGWLAADFAIAALVTGATLLIDPILAVGLGMIVALGCFVFRMSRTVVRRTYDAAQVGSRKARPARTARILAEHGQRIRVYDLQGAMFFGTAEQLAGLLEDLIAATAPHRARFVVLNLDRVSEIDSTAGQLLARLVSRLDWAGIRLVLAGTLERPALVDALEQHGVLAVLPPGRMFVDVDRAIEWSEDMLILEELTAVGLSPEIEFSRMELFRGMDRDSVARLQSAMIRHEYAAGEAVFREGDASDALYVIASGTASVKVADPQRQDSDQPGATGGRHALRPPGTESSEVRLITFSAGTVFGEFALLDRERRSATVQADEPLVCFSLSADALDRLRADHAPIVLALLRNLTLALSDRLRRTNRAIEHLSG